MVDVVQGVSGAPPAAGADPATTDNAALAEAFQNALLEGGIFMMQSLQSDASDAMNDTTSDPDAPF